MGHTHLLEHLDAFAHEPFVADQRRQVDVLLGHRCERLHPLPGQEQILDLLGFFFPAVPLEEVVVEVLRFGAHAAHVEADQAAGCVAGFLDVVALADRHELSGDDLERLLFRIALGEARLERFAPHLLEAVGHEVDRLPDVGDFGGQFDVFRADRCDRDRDVSDGRPVHELEGLAESGAAVVGQRVRLAIVGDLVAAPDLAADVDRVAGASHRLLERDAVPALDHLRP